MTVWNETFPTDAQLTSIHSVYLFLGLFVTLYGFLSLVIKDKLFLSEAFVATAFGIAIGPVGANLLDPIEAFGKDVNLVTLEFSRIIIGLQCLAAGIQSPGNFIYRERASMIMLLGPVMLVMWLVSTSIFHLVLGLNIYDALVIAACVTPTDPVLANSIIKGKFADMHIPRPLRNLLSAESAANDGLGLPFLLFPIYLSRSISPGVGIGWWIVNGLLYQICVAILIGIFIGMASRKLLKSAQKNSWTDNETILGFSLSLGIFLIGLFARIGVDEILGCFIVGVVISWDTWFNKQIEESHIQEVLDSVLNIFFFIFFGTRIPWIDMMDLPGVSNFYRLFFGCMMIIFLRRLPIMVLLKRFIPALSTWTEVIFCGWFGPIGAGAVFYAMIAIVIFDVEEKLVFPIVCLVVVQSILLHGGSVGIFHIGLTRQRTLESRQRSVPPELRNERKSPVDTGAGRVLQNDTLTSLRDDKTDNEHSQIHPTNPAAEMSFEKIEEVLQHSPITE